MIDKIFQLCVNVLNIMADYLGTTYEAVNVWIFCVIWPLFTLILICNNVRLHKKVNRLKKVPFNLENCEVRNPGYWGK